MSLTITKEGNKNFQHESGTYEDYGANDITIIFEGDELRLRSLSGRVIFNRKGYNYADVTIIDNSTGGSAETFPNVISLKQRLINLGYPFNGGSDTFDITTVAFSNVTGNPDTNPALVTYISENSVQSVSGIGNIDVDNTDPQNPIVSLTGVISGGTIT